MSDRARWLCSHSCNRPFDADGSTEITATLFIESGEVILCIFAAYIHHTSQTPYVYVHTHTYRERERERHNTAVAVGSSIGRRSRHFPDAFPSFFSIRLQSYYYERYIKLWLARYDLYGRRAPIHNIIKSHIHTAESIRIARRVDPFFATVRPERVLWEDRIAESAKVKNDNASSSAHCGRPSAFYVVVRFVVGSNALHNFRRAR